MSSWFRRPVNIAVTVVAVFMAVVAIAFIIWGVTHHEEGGLLEVCERDGVILYEAGSVEDTGGIETNHDSCERTKKLRWARKQIPLTIAPLATAQQPMAPDSPQVRVLKQAVSDFNQQVRFNLFRVGTRLESSDVEARFGGMLEKSRGSATGRGGMVSPPGYVTHKRVAGNLRAYVFIRSDVSASDRLLYVVLQHELGHVIGLAHDDFEISLMFPISRDDSLDDWMSTAHLTDADIELLRALYYRPMPPTFTERCILDKRSLWASIAPHVHSQAGF